MRHQIQSVRSNWPNVCDETELPEADRRFLRQRQFLNPLAFYGAPSEIGAADRIHSESLVNCFTDHMYERNNPFIRVPAHDAADLLHH